MLDLTDIASGYGETQVLHGLTLRAQAGRVLAILGRNGAGHDTLVANGVTAVIDCPSSQFEHVA